MAMKKQYVSVGGQVLYEADLGGVLTYGRDALGSVVAGYDHRGNAWFTARYKPYGEFVSTTGPVAGRRFLWVGSWGYRFTSGVPVSHYVRARHLSMRMGMWTSVDPLWPWERAYGYVGNRVTVGIDPIGTVPIDNKVNAFIHKRHTVFRRYGYGWFALYPPLTGSWASGDDREFDTNGTSRLRAHYGIDSMEVGGDPWIGVPSSDASHLLTGAKLSTKYATITIKERRVLKIKKPGFCQTRLRLGIEGAYPFIRPAPPVRLTIDVTFDVMARDSVHVDTKLYMTSFPDFEFLRWASGNRRRASHIPTKEAGPQIGLLKTQQELYYEAWSVPTDPCCTI